MKLLVTGFNSFGGQDLNPSWEMLRPIPTSYGEHEIVKVRVDTTWAGGGHQILAAMREHQPDAVLSFGLSGSYGTFRHESVGVNYGGTYRDNDRVVLDNLIDTSPTAPIGAPPTMPASTAVSWTSDSPVKGQESENAGDYICNQAAYLVGRAVAPGGEFAGMKFIFTHVPGDSLDWRSSSIFKRPIGDMARTAAAMIRGMFRDYLGVPEITDWGPVAPAPDLSPHTTEPPRSGYFNSTTGPGFRAYASFTDGIHGIPQRSDFNITDDGGGPGRGREGWTSNRRYFATSNNGMTFKVTRESDGVNVTAEKFGAESPDVAYYTWPRYYGDDLLVGVYGVMDYDKDLINGGPYIITLSGLDLLGNPFEVNMRVSYPDPNKAGTYELIT